MVNPTKGFGFIKPEEGDQDIFVHINDVERSGLTGLHDGQKVGFEIKEDSTGRQAAVDLVALDESDSQSPVDPQNP